ncbi:MAG: glucose-6-phosphate isomerase [Clostridia bacterium]|nr:glucose-6-phosphate isomerase [Clostridia bacterium]
MAIQLNDKFLRGFVNDHELSAMEGAVCSAHEKIWNKTGLGNDFLGWVDLPIDYDKEEFVRIKAAAEKIQKSCDILIVIGIGGSYLGARAAIEFCKSPYYNNLKKDTPDIYFAGCNISAQATEELLSICEGKDVCLNVISKSGTTTEPAIAFRIFREMLIQKYGPDCIKDRVFITTDKKKGTLKAFADEMGCETFVVPDDCGGRYSVLTAVGLLPIAVAGISIDDMMAGAAAARAAYKDCNLKENDCLKYAAYRNILHTKGKKTEILVSYEPCMTMMNEWWKQLYGESEGKDNKGLFPASVVFTTDLHSLGQFIQEGERLMFETIVSIKDTGSHIAVPNDEANVDGLNFLTGKTLDYINSKAYQGAAVAHNDGGVPAMVLELDTRSAYDFGYMVYFFEMACGISGYILGVNPFNQPGVEAYKKNMFALLGKPGYEDARDALEKRISE